MKKGLILLFKDYLPMIVYLITEDYIWVTRYTTCDANIGSKEIFPIDKKIINDYFKPYHNEKD